MCILDVSRRLEPPAHAVDPTDAWAEGDAFSRHGLSILPALEEDAQDPHNIDPENGPNHQDAGHVVPGPDPAAGNGDEDAANELQQIEQEDLRGDGFYSSQYFVTIVFLLVFFFFVLPFTELLKCPMLVVDAAVRRVLGQQLPGNVITARHFWQVLNKLRVVLSEGDLQKMENGHDFARVLERLARVITVPDEQDYMSAPGVHPLGYRRVFEALVEMTPDFSCPLDPVECLDRLREDLTATSSVIRAAEGVFVIKDREQYARRLRALAACIYIVSNV